MQFLHYLSVRGAAFLFAVHCVVIMLMPARYLFTLTGIALCILGLLFVKTDTGPAVVGIVVGVVLIGLGIRTVVRERRTETEEAEQTSEDVRRSRRSSR